MVRSVAAAIETPDDPESPRTIARYGTDSRYYAMIRGWLAQALRGVESRLQARRRRRTSSAGRPRCGGRCVESICNERAGSISVCVPKGHEIMVVVVFRSRLREEAADGFETLKSRMMDLARSMPGFVSYKVYVAEDGERVSIHEWESEEHLRAWREHPEHVEAQHAGRERYYAEYTSYILDSPRESRWPQVLA